MARDFGSMSELAGAMLTYNGSADVPTNAGTYVAVAVFDGAGNYGYAAGSALVTIRKATAALSWSRPAAIVFGTSLGGDQLNASADVFGSSGGAVTGLALVARHPGCVRTLIAHEPPLLELLPDAAEQRAHTEAIVDTFHRDGFGAAWMHFMRNAGYDVSPDDAPSGPAEPSEDEVRQAARFFEIDLLPTTRYRPDVDALKNSPSRVVIGIGADSGRLLSYRTSVALAELLGTTPVEFPGDHGGFLGAPTEFADTLRSMLS